MTKITKIYLDTECTNLHRNSTLISLALITEDNDIFYAEFNDYDKTQLNDWLQDNVLTNLLFNDKYTYCLQDDNIIYIKNNKQVITKRLIEWLDELNTKYDSVFELYSDWLAYDLMLFNDLFGTAFDIPKYIFYIAFDLATAFKFNNVDPYIDRRKFSGYIYSSTDRKNNSLTDAKVIKACFNKLKIQCQQLVYTPTTDDN